MRVPWKRDSHAKPITGGREARERAEKALEQTLAETPKYAELSRDLREIRERNHLAQAFYIAARGRPRT